MKPEAISSIKFKGNFLLLQFAEGGEAISLGFGEPFVYASLAYLSLCK